MIILIIVFIIIKIIVQYFPFIVFITDPTLKDAIYVLFRDVFIGLFGFMVFACAHYYDDFSWLAVDLLGVYYCTLLVFFTYAILGIIFSIFA